MLSIIVHDPSARGPAYPRDLRLPRLAAIFVTTGVLLLAPYVHSGVSWEKPPFHHATIESEEARYALGIAPVAEKGQGYPGVWVGRFIWDQGESAPRHYHLMARRTFTLKEAPKQATLKISVCDRYRLYVNGAYVGRGAARISRSQWTPYDTYNVAGLLGPGRNVIAVRAHHYGCSNNYTHGLRAGIFAQLDLTLPNGTGQVVATDESWRVLPIQGYRRDTPVLNGWHGIADEILDASKDPADWMQPEFDDSAWPGARVLVADFNPMRWADTVGSPWQCLEPRRVPMLRERRVAPTRVVKVAEAIEAPIDLAKESSVLERLTSEKHTVLEQAKAENVEALVGGAGPARLFGTAAGEGREARSPLLILDFGRPLFGCPELTLSAPAGALIDIIYDNRVNGEGIAARVTPHSILHVGDRLIARAGRQTWQLSDTRQFRYLQIVVRRTAEPVVLEKVEMISIEYPAPVRGQFECSEPVLTKVWQAGVNTVFLHMEDTHVCDATRERRQYSALQELRGGLGGIYAGFGDRFSPEEVLLTTKRMQLPDGQLNKYSSDCGGPETGMQFPNQNFGYALAVWDHYLRFGDKGFLTTHYPSLERLREWFEQYAVYDGLIYSLPNMSFMDWAPHELQGANLWVNAGYAEMLDAMARMAVELGRPPAEAVALKTRAGGIRATLRKLHWNEARGLFTDSVVAGSQSPMYSEMTSAYAILFGISDEGQRQRLVERVFDPKDSMTRPTPLDIGFIAQGLITAGAVDETLQMLVARFGPMVAGADFPTLSEGWTPKDWSGSSNSGIHDSPCGIMMVLLESILGVTPAEPGFARCRIEPHLGSLSWARGVVPTSRGDVRVSWRRGDRGRLTFEIVTPAGMPAELILPRPKDAADLVLDGRQVVTGGKPAEADVRLDATSLRVTLPGGTHQGELSSGDAK